MAIVRCEQGIHYYDNGRFDKCPHCGINIKNFKKHDNSINDQVTVRKNDVDVNEFYETIARKDNSIGIGDLDEVRTVGYISSVKGNDYITGWLVCIDGPEKGRDYRLHHGFNRLGRSHDMDIVVMEDSYISRDTHCMLVYDGKHNAFYASPSVGTLTYLNGELLDKSLKIKVGDILRIGESEFEFIPFCREGRVWDNKGE